MTAIRFTPEHLMDCDSWSFNPGDQRRWWRIDGLKDQGVYGVFARLVTLENGAIVLRLVTVDTMGEIVHALFMDHYVLEEYSDNVLQNLVAAYYGRRVASD